MCAINARTINGVKPEEEFFYYNNSRNHFWRVLQHLHGLPESESPQKFTIKGKKEFLNKHAIAICNLVSSINIPNTETNDPSDEILFKAYKKERIAFKSVSPKVKKMLRTTPLFFTSRRKKGIENLLDGFLKQNQMDLTLKDNIWYWATPTRCNPYARSQMWKKEALTFAKERKLMLKF